MADIIPIQRSWGRALRRQVNNYLDQLQECVDFLSCEDCCDVYHPKYRNVVNKVPDISKEIARYLNNLERLFPVDEERVRLIYIAGRLKLLEAASSI